MPASPVAQELTDSIYSALVGEKSWQNFLDELREILPNGKGFLSFHDAIAGTGALPLNSGLDVGTVTAFDSYYSKINPWMQGVSVRQIGRTVRADSMLSHGQLVKTEFYGDWLRPQQLDSGIGVTIFREQHCSFLIGVLAADADEAVYEDAIEHLQALVPHLRRAFNWYRKDQNSAFGLFNGTGLNDSLRVGVITVGVGCRVRTINGSAARMLRQNLGLSVDRANRLRCSLPDVTECIDAMLLTWVRERCGAPPRRFLLPQGDRLLPMRLTVVAPPREQEAAFFRGPECIVFLEDPNLELDVAADEFGSLHNLTAAERRVVAGLAAGQTLDEIAARAGTSLSTIRNQLKAVFAKTGISRQVDLIRNICFLAATILDRSAIGRTK